MRWPLPTAPLVAQTVPTASYPELAGMFSQAAGLITGPSGEWSQWAWTTEGEPPGSAKLYWNTGTWWDQATGWYERFAVKDGWVRLLGWTAYGTDVYLPIRSEGEAGQRYALVHADGPYAFSVEATLTGPDVTLRYADAQMWAPTGDGWTQHEIFRWLDGTQPPAFQSVVTITPRRLFASAYQTFVDSAGGVTHGPRLGTSAIWTWS